MSIFNFDSSKRHLAKTLTWRFVATADTIIIGFFVTGNFDYALKIGIFEIFTKMFLYYFHERLWFISKFNNYKIRHILKTFSWRAIGTVDTIIISFLITGSFNSAVQLGSIELLTKMIAYYLHEKIWYFTKYGLKKT